MSDRIFSGARSEVENLIYAVLQKGRAWNMSVLTYNSSQQIVRVENCYGFMFTNIGDTIARVNGMVIFPNANPATGLGDSRGVAAHRQDIYKGLINLSFDNPAGPNPLVEIVQFYYVSGITEIRED